MAQFTNKAAGARGVNLKDGSTVWINPGQTEVIEDDDILNVHADLLNPLDHDGNGEKGGSLPDAPVALSGKNKAQLLEIAADEGVEIEDGATNADIVSAIELAREAKANG